MEEIIASNRSQIQRSDIYQLLKEIITWGHPTQKTSQGSFAFLSEYVWPRQDTCPSLWMAYLLADKVNDTL